MTTENVKVEIGERKECPYCKEMVSAKPGPYAIHIKRCSLTHPILSDVKNEDIKRTIEKALATQESMLNAPDVSAIDLNTDVNMSLRKRYAPETLDVHDSNGQLVNYSTHTAYFGDNKEQAVDISKGYVPKINEHGEYVVNMGGDILYTRDRRITDKFERLAQEESRRRLATVTTEAQMRSTARGVVDAPGNADGVIKQEEYGVSGTVTIGNGDI